MERALACVKLTLPDAWQLTPLVTVRIGDINYGGHLGNDAVLSLVHEVRLYIIFKSLGYSEIDIRRRIVLADAVVVKCAEAFHGDALRVRVGLGDLTPTVLTCLPPGKPRRRQRNRPRQNRHRVLIIKPKIAP